MPRCNERIGVALKGNITPHESEQTSITVFHHKSDIVEAMASQSGVVHRLCLGLDVGLGRVLSDKAPAAPAGLRSLCRPVVLGHRWRRRSDGRHQQRGKEGEHGKKGGPGSTWADPSNAAHGGRNASL